MAPDGELEHEPSSALLSRHVFAAAEPVTDTIIVPLHLTWVDTEESDDAEEG